MKCELPTASEASRTDTDTTPHRESSDFEIDTNQESRERELAAVHKWTRGFFEMHYPNFPFGTKNHFLNYCEREGFATTGIGPRTMDREGASNAMFSGKTLLTREYSETRGSDKVFVNSDVIISFFEEIIDYVNKKAAGDPDSAKLFCQNMGGAMENIRNTWISSNLDIAQEFGIAANAWNTPCLRQALAGPLLSETWDRIEGAGMNEVRDTSDALSALPQSERMNIIRLVPMLSNANEDEKAVTDLTRRQEKYLALLTRLADTDIPTVRFAAMRALAATEQDSDPLEEKDVKRSLWDSVLEKDTSPCSPEQEAVSVRLKRTVIPEHSLPYGYSAILPIASDMVAFYDEDYIPQHLARIDSETLSRLIVSESDTDWGAVNRIREFLLEKRVLTKDRIKESVSGLSKCLFSDESFSDTDTLAKRFFSASGVIAEDRWKDLLDGMSRVQSYEQVLWKNIGNIRERIAMEHAFRINEKERRLKELTETHTPENKRLQRELLNRFAADNAADSTRQWQEEDSMRESLKKAMDIGSAKKTVSDILEELRNGRDRLEQDFLVFIESRIEAGTLSGEIHRVSPVSYDDLFKDSAIIPFEPNGGDLENIRLLQQLHAPDGAELLGMPFDTLPIRSQVHFLLTRIRENDSAAERFRLVLEKHPALKDDIAYSFLVTAEGSEYGETVLTLAESLDTETLGPILKKYAEITKDADAVAEFVRMEFSDLDVTETASVTETITKNLLRRGRELLVEFSKHADSDTLLRRLDNISASVELYKKTFRSLYESGKLKNPADMANSEILSLSPEDLSEVDKEWMRNLYRKSYPEESYSSSFREAIFAGLDKRMENIGPGTRCHILKRNGKNVSFVFFEDTGEAEDGRVEKFGSSFNVEPEYRSDMVGGAFWDTVLASESNGSIITITGDHALPNPVSDFYINKKGFFGIGMRTVGDRPLPLLRRDEQQEKKLLTRKTTVAMSFELGERIAADTAPHAWSKWVTAEKTDRDGMEQTIIRRTAEGFFLSCILTDPKDTTKNNVVLIFEDPDERMNIDNRHPSETATAHQKTETTV
ncbi:MAG: hypothetical protein HGA31_00365 [Candidatus Moranbacteria bacterium]|nr:hypothetical protein [Candidatus Moranbacteria bacterium]